MSYTSTDETTFAALLRQAGPGGKPVTAAWYIIPSKSICARWFNLLHWPYTLWHLSYVVIGAGLAEGLDWPVLCWTVLAFFLGMGIAAHCFDQLHGDPLRLGIKAGRLRFVGLTALAGAMAIGIWQIWAGQVPTQLVFAVPIGASLAYGYGQEWKGFHGDWQFAAWWAVFPFLVGYLAQGLDFNPAVAALVIFAFMTALVQRVLSTRVRYLRRQVGQATVTLETWHERQQEWLFGVMERKPWLLAPDEKALAGLSAAMVLHAVSGLLFHV